jgi:hypothetical protein
MSFRRLVVLLLVASLPPAVPAVPFWGATESRPPDIAPTDLQPGELVWNPGVSPMGMTVVVVDERTAPTDVANPPAFAPVDSTTGVPAVPDRLAVDHEFRLEPEKSPHGPVSILMSAADERVLVLRNGVEIGRARLTVRDPGQPLGTHAYVMTEEAAAESSPLRAGGSLPRWTAVAMPGHFDEAGRAHSHQAAARVAMPKGFARALETLVAPGTTLFVTDAPILAENTHSSFTVLADGAPEDSGP